MADNKRDYYEVLGVDKSATDDVIKKAYRKLAKPVSYTHLDVYKRQICQCDQQGAQPGGRKGIHGEDIDEQRERRAVQCAQHHGE